MMIVIMIASYVSIPSSLTVLNEAKEDFIILTPDKNIYDFMKIMYENVKIELYDIPSASLNTINPIAVLHNVRQINNYKNNIRNLIDSFKNCTIYFDLVIYCDYEFWIIKELSKHNKVIYMPSTEKENLAIKLNTPRAVWYGFLNKIVYHTKLQSCIHGSDLTLILTDRYLKDVNAEIYRPEIEYEKIGETIREKFNLKKVKVLLLCGGVVDYIVKKEKYIETVDEIVDFLIKLYGIDNIYIKAHPRFQDYYSKENELNKIAPELPASLITGISDIVIGYSSSTLYESTLIGKKVISLLKLIESFDKRKTVSLSEFLNSNMDKSNPILFPETMSEFKSLISSYEKGEIDD